MSEERDGSGPVGEGAEPPAVAGPGSEADSPREVADPREAGADPRLGGLTALEVTVVLGMQPHREGGYFRETYRSPLTVYTEAGARPLSTAILYLLTTTEPSRFHRLRSDEVWFHHAGAPAEVVILGPGSPEYRTVCFDVPQLLVPAHRWMAARVIVAPRAHWGAGRVPERRWKADRRRSPDLLWTLVSCVVTPGFEYDDFELGEREFLLKEFPRARQVIRDLT